MSIPNLKRVKISSQHDLKIWLSKHADQPDRVMLVLHGKRSADKYISPEQVRDALNAHGWINGPRYTLNAHQIGHVISKQPDTLVAAT